MHSQECKPTLCNTLLLRENARKLFVAPAGLLAAAGCTAAPPQSAKSRFFAPSAGITCHADPPCHLVSYTQYSLQLLYDYCGTPSGLCVHVRVPGPKGHHVYSMLCVPELLLVLILCQHEHISNPSPLQTLLITHALRAGVTAGLTGGGGAA